MVSVGATRSIGAQRRHERGAVADNLLEIVFAENLFPQIDVLAFELRFQPADSSVLAHVLDRERQLVRHFLQQLRLRQRHTASA